MRTLVQVIEDNKITYFNGVGHGLSAGALIAEVLERADGTATSFTRAMRARCQSPDFAEIDDGDHYLFTWDSEDSGYAHNCLDQHIFYDIDHCIIKCESSKYVDAIVKDGQWPMPCDMRAVIISMRMGLKIAPESAMRVYDLTSQITQAYLVHYEKESLPPGERQAISVPLANTFTEAGRNTWMDVFTASVAISEHRHNGQVMYTVHGITPNRFEQFADMINGVDIQSQIDCLHRYAWHPDLRETASETNEHTHNGQGLGDMEPL